MAVNQYTKPWSDTYVPVPMDFIADSERKINANKDKTADLGNSLNVATAGNYMQRSDATAKDQIARYDKANEGQMASRILLNNIRSTPDDAPKLENLRNTYLEQLKGLVDNYADNPYMLSSGVAAITNELKSSYEQGDIYRIKDNYNGAAKRMQEVEDEYQKGERSDYNRQLALEEAQNNRGFPTEKGIAEHLSRLMNNFTPEGGYTDFNRVLETGMALAKADPKVSEIMRRMGTQGEAYIASLVNGIANREAGWKDLSRSKSSSSGANGDGVIGNMSYGYVNDYGKSNVMVISPATTKDANERLNQEERMSATKQYINLQDGKVYKPNEIPNFHTALKYNGEVRGGGMNFRETMGTDYRDEYAGGSIISVDGVPYFSPMNRSELSSPDGKMDVDLSNLSYIQHKAGSGKAVLRLTGDEVNLAYTPKTGYVMTVTKPGHTKSKNVMDQLGGITIQAPTYQEVYDRYLKILNNGATK